jgi:hypothetical protein
MKATDMKRFRVVVVVGVMFTNGGGSSMFTKAVYLLIGAFCAMLFGAIPSGSAATRYTFKTVDKVPQTVNIAGMEYCRVNASNELGYLVGECEAADVSYAFQYRPDGSHELLNPDPGEGFPAGCRALGITPTSTVIVGACGTAGWLYDGTSNRIDVPGADATTLFDVLDDPDGFPAIVVGRFCAGGRCSGFTWALLEEDSSPQVIEVPGAVYTSVHDIKRNGELSGVYHGEDGVHHSFTAKPKKSR